jgi:UDP-N-acetylmuramoyl-L-alanyl-D-glutamate--2,6-diaminopimelate ligase
VGPYLIAGLGRAGHAAGLALAELAGAGAIRCWDAQSSGRVERTRTEFDALGVATHTGGDGVELLAADPAPACVVKSPGIPRDALLLQAADERGIAVVDEAELGWRLDRRPLVGVTGTNGKSTVCALVAALLSRSGADAVIAGNTFLGPPLSGLRDRDEDVVVAELSSFQLEYCPALLPDAAVFTNLTDDHWEWHGGREGYARAKRRMLLRGDRCVPAAAVGVDDPFGARLAAEIVERGGTLVGFGWSPDARCRITSCDWGFDEGRVTVALDGRKLELRTQLPGRHNAANVAAALSLAAALGLDLKAASAAIEEAEPVPGRMEPLREGQPFDAIVDYAHNPDGLRQALEAARHVLDSRGGGHVIVVASVLSALDERQRREMGAAIGALADRTVVTLDRVEPDEPADRPPAGLVEGIEAAGGAYEVLLRRDDAIEWALRQAQAGDAVLIVNRGARGGPLLDVDDEGRRFDDRAETRALLARLGTA